MAASTYVFVFAVLTSEHVIGSLAAQVPCGIGANKAPPNQWNPDADNLKVGAEKLRTTVIKCCKEKFAMTPAIDLVMRNIPVDFNVWNDRPRGCVELQLEIEEIRTDSKGKETIQNKWNVEIDVDNKTDKQTAHYGYTVYSSKVSKFTGHVCLPANVYPPNVRPFIGQSKGQVVYLSDKMAGPSKNTVFKLSGKMYNQYKTKETVKEGDSFDDNEGDEVTQLLLDHLVDGKYVDRV